jgi:hypothetical protein
MDTARAIVRAAVDPEPREWGPMSRSIRLQKLWTAGLTLCASAFWTLVFAGLVRITARRPEAAPGDGPSLAGRWAVALAAGAPIALAVAAGLPAPPVCAVALMAAALAALICPTRLLRRIRANGWSALRIAGWLYAAAIFAWQADAVLGGFVWDWMETRSDIDASRPGALFLALVGGTVVALPALLTVLVSGLFSLVRRVPLRAGVVRGVGALAAPIGCLLIIGYGGLVIATAHEEAIAGAYMRQRMANELRFYAKMEGRAWPSALR